MGDRLEPAWLLYDALSRGAPCFPLRLLKHTGNLVLHNTAFAVPPAPADLPVTPFIAYQNIDDQFRDARALVVY